jgi:diphthamide synthase (EF-2-diphthine--ammonia ligase)
MNRETAKNKNEEGRYERAWGTHASWMGLKEEWLGKKMDNKTIIGLDLKKRKYIIALRDEDGKVYKTTVRNLLQVMC